MQVAINEENVVSYFNDGTTERFTAWSAHCGKFYEELVKLIIDRKYILAKDILTASALITDIQIRSTTVPFNNKIEDMSDELYHWISLSVRGNVLKDFFAPVEQ